MGLKRCLWILHLTWDHIDILGIHIGSWLSKFLSEPHGRSVLCGIDGHIATGSMGIRYQVFRDDVDDWTVVLLKGLGVSDR